MATLTAVTMVRNSNSTPSTAAATLTKTAELFDVSTSIGLALTTAIDADVLVDPDDSVGFIVFHGTSSTGAGTLTLSAGDYWQNIVGDKAFTIGSSATGEGNVYFLGPFESAKYSEDTTAGPSMTFTLTGAGSTCCIMAFKMPTKVSYAT